MDFYTYHYLENNQQNQQLLLTVLMLFAFLAAVGFMIGYLKNRLKTRYRDLGIIALLCLLLLTGIEGEKFMNLNDQAARTTQMLPFIRSVARDEGVKTNQVLVNSTTIVNGMIVRLKPEKQNYQVTFSSDNKTYTLKKVHVINHQVEVKN
ncbi:MAG TPA: DUF3290 domain-containing protein [Candidatus Limosilactobacillus faecipullorum]|nr:DUF3290 domain-containing protein [Candidatus Limosilactobacillus faecipullorum]